jgi:molecular chaperone DnaK (HSP70)
VHVNAKDPATGKEQSMQITGGSAFGKGDIDRMVKEAESHAEEDRKRHVSVGLRNEADNLPYREATQRERPQDHRRERNGGGVACQRWCLPR